ncbi:NACHT domain protein [Posidoniimonas polymericola]|uniref:NACHT domain protein n=1 Tax=Posidoniimonas polymericola TaxID=2528002 RepID=A0A5C5ZEL5_9BACT|nr:AAA family ATPase [Posidoniimonas polymericola]TWT85595.1 NACHT domain protein [Posidoniimonas polymericola]
MYADYWQLDAKPFEPHPDEESYFPSESHDGAQLKLRYALDQRRPAAALAGPSGVGKTLLVDRIIADLGDHAGPVVKVVFPQMSPRDLLTHIADALEAPLPENPRRSTDEAVARIDKALAASVAAGRHTLLVIDEAHLLEDGGLLETVRLLLNLAAGATPRMTLLLVGQMGLLSAMGRATSLEERLSVKTLLRSFVSEETAEYLQHRLNAAGASREVFTPAAVEAVHQITGGIPRQIDRLCDLALLVGFAEQLAVIDEPQIHSVSKELLALSTD